MAIDEGTRPAADSAPGRSAALEVRTEVLADGVHVLHVVGEIDALTRGAFAEALNAAVARSAAPVVVDLTRVGFLAASGIGALAGAWRLAVGSGVELRLAGPGRGARRALQLTGLLDVVPCHDTLAEALAATS